eukprot:SAG31_NODE_2133_length_6372_cov_4.372071_6_plen_67_part_00
MVGAATLARVTSAARGSGPTPRALGGKEQAARRCGPAFREPRRDEYQFMVIRDVISNNNYARDRAG